MEIKHTPGPWRISNDWITDSSSLESIAKIVGKDGPDCRMTDHDLANARLIAAAPALLEACKNIVAWLNDVGKTNKSRRGRVPSRLLDAIETAIALAEKGE